jgi:hypothetical protein
VGDNEDAAFAWGQRGRLRNCGDVLASQTVIPFINVWDIFPNRLSA